MVEANNTTVTLQVHRFTPRPERAERARGGSPFAKKSSPFGGGSDSAARRRPRGKQWVQEYTIPARPSDTVLDCLLTIKRTIDPTLAFRYSCGHGMCGSDAAAINGTPTLLCTATVRDWAKQPSTAPEVDDEGFRRTGDETANEPDVPAENVENNIPEGSLGVIELASLPGFPPQRISSPTSTRCSTRFVNSPRIFRLMACLPPPPKAKWTFSNTCRTPSSSPSMRR